MDKITQLFPTPFLKSQLEVTYNVLEFANYLNYHRAETAYISEDKNVLDYPHMLPFKEQIETKLQEYFYDVCGMQQCAVPVITTSWVNLNRKGDYNETHIHYNSVLSGVWYLSVTENTGDFIFIREGRELFGNTFSFQQEALNQFNSQLAAFVPQVGDLFIFPSCVKHRVGVNLDEYDRLTLAFNCLIKGSAQSEGVEILI